VQDVQAELNTLVRRELWTSLVGLLRSQIGALQVTGRLSAAQLVEATQELEINIRTAGAILTLRFDAESGVGIWTEYKGRQTMGSWSMTTGGSVAVDGQALDMELAVEHFAAKLV